MVLCAVSFADEVNIPFGVKMKSFKKSLKSKGLDFDGNDDSLGFIENKGMSLTLFSYRNLTKEELYKIQVSASDTYRAKKK